MILKERPLRNDPHVIAAYKLESHKITLLRHIAPQLTDGQIDIIVAHGLVGYSAKELAHLCGCHLGTIYKWLAEIRAEYKKSRCKTGFALFDILT